MTIIRQQLYPVATILYPHRLTTTTTTSIEWPRVHTRRPTFGDVLGIGVRQYSRFTLEIKYQMSNSIQFLEHGMVDK